MQEACNNRRGIQAQVRQNAGHLNGVRKIGVSRMAKLIAMHLGRVHIGAVKQRLVRLGIVGENPIHQFILAQHCIQLLTTYPNDTA